MLVSAPEAGVRGPDGPAGPDRVRGDPGRPGARRSCSTSARTSRDYLADVGLVAALFCAISLVVGYVVPRAFGVVDDQAIASSMEIGVHNATLAIYVAVEVLDSTEISVPAAVYSLFMFAFAALWGAVISRRLQPVAVPTQESS